MPCDTNATKNGLIGRKWDGYYLDKIDNEYTLCYIIIMGPKISFDPKKDKELKEKRDASFMDVLKAAEKDLILDDIENTSKTHKIYGGKNENVKRRKADYRRP